MNFRTQLLLGKVVFVAVFAVISISIIATSQQVSHLNGQVVRAQNVERGAHELSLISNDYLLFGGTRQQVQWETKFASLSHEIEQIEPITPDEQQLLTDIKADLGQVRDIFSQIQITREMSNKAPETPPTIEFVQTAWSRLMVQNDAMIADADQMANLKQDEANRLNAVNTLLVYVALAVLLVVLLVMFFLFSRRMLGSVLLLTDGARAIGRGDLSYRFDDTGSDEFYVLAQEFNRMVDDLQHVTASKIDLEQEIKGRESAVAALIESESQYRSLFENLPEGLAYCRMEHDLSGIPENFTYLAANPAFYRITAVTDVTGRKGTEVFPGITEMYPDLFRTYGDVAAGGPPVAVDIYFATIRKWLHVSLYSPVPDHVVSLFDDITERKKAEESLRETNEYLQNLINHANAPIIVWDPQSRITRFNHAFEHLTGLTEREVTGQDLEILFPDESRDDSLKLIRKTLEGERWETVEIPIRHVSGETKTVLWNSANITDHQGRIVSTIAQGQDISDRKKAELAVLQSENKFRLLAESASDWVYWIDNRQELVYVSPSCERITGYTPSDFFEHSELLERIVDNSDKAAFIQHVTENTSSTRPGFLEFRIINKNKETRWIDHTCTPIFDDRGSQVGRRIRNQDITERKIMEGQREKLIRDLEQKNAELERFTYTISHDLRSPMITIRGFTGLLEKDISNNNTDNIRKDLERINTATGTMETLLREVLELSRIGRVVNPPEKIAFGTIAHEAADLLEGLIRERGVLVTIAPDLPEINVDHVRIREVLTNLIENAVKFMGDQPHPEISIGMRENGEEKVFFVRDNGIGIEPKFQERVFNLFEKLDVKAEGSGAGLAIVRRIIEVHGGTIWVESEGAGKGCTFWFTLPIVRTG